MIAIDALQVIDDTELRSAPMNMAMDEALLQTAETPTLRCYRWRAPSLSFGYFSRFDDVRTFCHRRETVRRWTGGGIVMHGEDLTYSFVVPATHCVSSKPPRELYSLLHRAISTVLARSGVDATLAVESAPRSSDACFANPVRADVMIGERKIAGAAQRRCRFGLLQQGSIQLDRLRGDFAHEFADAICAKARDGKLTAGQLSLAKELAERKYGTDAWLTRR